MRARRAAADAFESWLLPRGRLGPPQDLIRLPVGIEDAEAAATSQTVSDRQTVWSTSFPPEKLVAQPLLFRASYDQKRRSAMTPIDSKEGELLWLTLRSM